MREFHSNRTALRQPIMSDNVGLSDAWISITTMVDTIVQNPENIAKEAVAVPIAAAPCREFFCVPIHASPGGGFFGNTALNLRLGT